MAPRWECLLAVARFDLGRMLVHGPIGPVPESLEEILSDLLRAKARALVVDGLVERDSASARVPEAGECGIDLRRAVDDDGDDGGLGLLDDEPDARLEGDELARGAFEAALGEDAYRAALCEFTQRSRAAAGSPAMRSTSMMRIQFQNVSSMGVRMSRAIIQRMS